MPPPNWRAFQEGAGGGGAATTKRKQAERQQASLCDVLMTTALVVKVFKQNLQLEFWRYKLQTKEQEPSQLQLTWMRSKEAKTPPGPPVTDEPQDLGTKRAHRHVLHLLRGAPGSQQWHEEGQSEGFGRPFAMQNSGTIETVHIDLLAVFAGSV